MGLDREWTERLLYSAIRLALARDERELAALLLQAEVDDFTSYAGNRMDVHLSCLPSAFDTLQGYMDHNESTFDPDESLLTSLFRDVTPAPGYVGTVTVRVNAGAPDAAWREQMRDLIESGPSNQGRPFGTSRVLTHGGLNYRSKAEVAIAETLEKSDDILFLPNCSSQAGKVQREPDFLIFYKGRSGTLEVDGPTHAGRLAEDTLRDSYFQRQGIFVKHYTSEKCSADPGWVVKDFLSLMLKAR